MLRIAIYIGLTLLLFPFSAFASDVDKELCEVFGTQEKEMAKKLPYRVSEFWLNTQYSVSCSQKTIFIGKKHTVLKVNEFEATAEQDFKSQMVNSPMCKSPLFQSETGWTFNITLQDVEGVYVTNARINYETCKQAAVN